MLYYIAIILLRVMSAIQSQTTEEVCQQIYNACYLTYTEDQAEFTKRFIQDKFAATDPTRAPCHVKDMYVRKDIKCLTQREIDDLVEVWLELYADGTVDQYVELHATQWGPNHKGSEGNRGHLEFINQFELEMRRRNKNVTMPYWTYALDFARPELSIIWEIFGHSGNESNGHCIPDGPFANISVNYPTPHCVRRQWRPDGTLEPWKSPEWFTMIQQMRLEPNIILSLFKTLLTQLTPEMLQTLPNFLQTIDLFLNYDFTPYIQRLILFALESHFDTHLSVGGCVRDDDECGNCTADLSIMIAPADPVFFPLHLSGDVYDLLWGLINDLYLVPKSYNNGIRIHHKNNERFFPDIDTSVLDFYPEILVRETFQHGFGDHCYVYDSVIVTLTQLFQQQQQLLDEGECDTEDTEDSDEDLEETPNSTESTDSTDVTADNASESPNALAEPRSQTSPLPVAAQRLKDVLPYHYFEKYYPDFASGHWNGFHHVLPPIYDYCNAGNETTACKPMPRAKHFRDTPQGRQQYAAFGASVSDFTVQCLVDTLEQFYDEFMDVLDEYGYCSPYVA